MLKDGGYDSAYKSAVTPSSPEAELQADLFRLDAFIHAVRARVIRIAEWLERSQVVL